ncbi:MAG: hypothetical protein V1704_01370 [Candidatus Vogelbacteria bacterium]
MKNKHLIGLGITNLLAGIISLLLVAWNDNVTIHSDIALDNIIPIIVYSTITFSIFNIYYALRQNLVKNRRLVRTVFAFLFAVIGSFVLGGVAVASPFFITDLLGGIGLYRIFPPLPYGPTPFDTLMMIIPTSLILSILPTVFFKIIYPRIKSGRLWLYISLMVIVAGVSTDLLSLDKILSSLAIPLVVSIAMGLIVGHSINKMVVPF